MESSQDHHQHINKASATCTKMNRNNQVHPMALAISDISSSETKEKLQTSKPRVPLVGFRSIQIREFERIVGDHPDVTHGGPPLGIGWDYVEGDVLDIDEYEKQKSDYIAANSDTPWLIGLRRMSSGRRRDLLGIEFNVPLDEIIEAELQVELVKKQRAQTNGQKKVFAMTEEIIQSAKRKLNRKLKRRFSRDLLDYQSFPKRREVQQKVATVVPSPLDTADEANISLHPPLAPPASIPQKPIRMREISV
ncbi:expressed unknown protein [Seminavis robusta]|uniref:Uncharacterized protein n=1 Tax=Seminavis robusta TaxID=568900 RepID=A0A9N8DZW0_9STRA|nr:expressed unknown protein [Seminavis robusta]|eukprot:Sro511_g157400.1 n/a (250) ;mRNA; r:22335-23084